MIWLLVSLIGLIIVILTVRFYYKENQDIKSRKKRGLVFIFFLIASVASESSVLYLGLLLILFGLVKAAGLL
ncbi:hypothetical protein [Neobacillus drentensis]|uniref:hypothetical protein n=1 Tax=Neobacillus drentensis TaxID=220684 RepID=UPI0008268434|nr:hypothetical protein [Neobacillus drentensis]